MKRANFERDVKGASSRDENGKGAERAEPMGARGGGADRASRPRARTKKSIPSLSLLSSPTAHPRAQRRTQSAADTRDRAHRRRRVWVRTGAVRRATEQGARPREENEDTTHEVTERLSASCRFRRIQRFFWRFLYPPREHSIAQTARRKANRVEGGTERPVSDRQTSSASRSNLSLIALAISHQTLHCYIYPHLSAQPAPTLEPCITVL